MTKADSFGQLAIFTDGDKRAAQATNILAGKGPALLHRVGQKRELFTYVGVKALFEVNRARIKFTKDDGKLGIAPIPENYYTGTYTVTPDNVKYFLG